MKKQIQYELNNPVFAVLQFMRKFLIKYVEKQFENFPIFQPVRIGGIKVYDKNTDRNEIIMDLDIL